VTFHVDRAGFDGDPFRLEQPSLQPGNRLANQEPTSGANNALPGDRSAPRARRHGVADGARSTGKTERSGQLSISCYAPARNFLHQAINCLPGHL
jgi:hypothetical protein